MAMETTNLAATFARFNRPHTFALAMAGRQDAIDMISQNRKTNACPSRFFYPAWQAGSGAWR